jgi:hypothetical protein
MNERNMNRNYSKLPIVSLTSGIIALSPIVAYLTLLIITHTILSNPIDEKIILNIMISSIIIGVILAINAIICGGINYRKTKGINHTIRKNFDIAGIIMGIAVIFLSLFFFV